MDIYTIDFETYYDREYSLSKLTTEEYINDPRFEIIGFSVKLNNGEAVWHTGDFLYCSQVLHDLDLPNNALLAHNAMFDGAILGWKFGIYPKVYLDTMCMGQILVGQQESVSLRNLCLLYGVGEKGTEVMNAIGKRLSDFYPSELAAYGGYCCNDSNKTYDIYQEMMGYGFPKSELKLIDITLRMFTRPMVLLDKPKLESHLVEIRQNKEQLLVEAGVRDKRDLTSDAKFADLLRAQGVEPPTKLNAKGHRKYAFAKTDESFKELAEHENEIVQALVAARLGHKTTLNEQRTERLIGIHDRNNGLLPIPLGYAKAISHRWVGLDKINLQNLPSRVKVKTLKASLVAPPGYVFVAGDSSQIEARTNAWFSGQWDVVNQFAAGEDVYKIMAAKIFGCRVSEVTETQRFLGKQVILAAGYSMGHRKFYATLRSWGVKDYTESDCAMTIGIYRQSMDKIASNWSHAETYLNAMSTNRSYSFGNGCVETMLDGIYLPNGMMIRYPDLQRGTDGFTYSGKRGKRTNIYGGKVIENLIQALARIIVGYQMIKISRHYPIVLTVHDSIVSLVPESEADHARELFEAYMKMTPPWAADLPVACEVKIGDTYDKV